MTFSGSLPETNDCFKTHTHTHTVLVNIVGNKFLEKALMRLPLKFLLSYHICC